MFWNSNREWYFTTRNCLWRKHYIYAKQEVIRERNNIIVIVYVQFTITAM